MVTCIFSLFEALNGAFDVHFFRVSFLHLIKDTDSIIRVMQLRCLKVKTFVCTIDSGHVWLKKFIIQQDGQVPFQDLDSKSTDFSKLLEKSPSTFNGANAIRFWRDDKSTGAFQVVLRLIRWKLELKSLKEIGKEEERFHFGQLSSETLSSTYVRNKRNWDDNVDSSMRALLLRDIFIYILGIRGGDRGTARIFRMANFGQRKASDIWQNHLIF